jgi:hypothetical protein
MEMQVGCMPNCRVLVFRVVGFRVMEMQVGCMQFFVVYASVSRLASGM